MSVSVEIGNLVLLEETGAPLDPERLRRHVEAALEEMLLARGFDPATAPGPDACLPQQALRLPVGAGDRQLAQGVAQSVFRVLGGGA